MEKMDRIDSERNSKDKKKLSPEEVKRQLIEMAKKYKTVPEEEKEEVMAKLNSLEKSMNRERKWASKAVKWMINDLKKDLKNNKNFDIDNEYMDLSEEEFQERNDKIQKEIANWNYKNTYKLTKITDESIDLLSNFKWETLQLWWLIEISDYQAERLSSFDNPYLELHSVKKITDTQAAYLSKYKWESLYL